MNRLFCLASFLCAILSFGATAIEQNYAFDDANKQAIFTELTHELRCPKCQNQNIADSNAMVAIDLKNKTYELVKEGQNKQQVVDFMVARYGQFVHYDPPINKVTIWLWVLPALLFVGLIFIMLKRKKESEPQVASDYLAEAEKMLQQLDSQNKQMSEQTKQKSSPNKTDDEA